MLGQFRYTLYVVFILGKIQEKMLSQAVLIRINITTIQNT
jgi:hypothetical protein